MIHVGEICVGEFKLNLGNYLIAFVASVKLLNNGGGKLGI